MVTTKKTISCNRGNIYKQDGQWDDMMLLFEVKMLVFAGR